MLLFPRKLRYKKIHRKQLKKNTRIRSALIFQKSSSRLICNTSSLIKSRQIEATRKSLSRIFKNKSKLYTYIFPDLPLTAKPTAMRMGKGKGNFKEWTCKVKAGTTLFQIKGLSIPAINKLINIKKLNKFIFNIKLK